MESEAPGREKITLKYFLVPGILTFIVFIFTLLGKLLEATPNEFATWGMLLLIWFLTIIVTFGISFSIYLFVSMKEEKPKERTFNDRATCDVLLRKEVRERTGYQLKDFSDTADSIEGIRWYGDGEDADKVKVYYHLYRVVEGQRRRYLIAVMDMEEGKQDNVSIRQSPMNYADLYALVDEMGNGMCKKPVRTVKREKIYTDNVSGRSEVEREESPLQQPENMDDSQGELL